MEYSCDTTKERVTYHGVDLEKTVAVRNVVVDLNTGPTWSPDSKKILYVKRVRYNSIQYTFTISIKVKATS